MNKAFSLNSIAMRTCVRRVGALASVLLLAAAPLAQAIDLIVIAEPSAGGYAYPNVPLTGLTNGQQIAVYAAPEAGYRFDRWVNFGGAVIASPLAQGTTVTMTGIPFVTVAARFVSTAPVYSLTVTNDGNGTTSPSGTFSNAAGGTWSTTISATPSTNPPPGYVFNQWTPSAGITDPNSPNTSIIVDNNKTITATFRRLWLLTVNTPSGPASASYTSNMVNGVLTTVAVPSETVGTASNFRYRCTGWVGGSGSIPATGGALSYGPFSPTTNSTIQWTWIRQYRVSIVSGPGGTTVPLPGDTWYDEGTVITLTAVAAADHTFVQWTVGANITTTPSYTFTVTGPVTATALFTPTSPDTDGDGLPDTWENLWGLNPRDNTGANGAGGDPDRDGLSNSMEYNYSVTNRSIYYNPVNADTDGDGMDDYYEWARIDPTNRDDDVTGGGGFIPAAVDNGSRRVANGRNGNADEDFLWNTYDGYRNEDAPLNNWMEYVGPDTLVPVTYTTLNFGDVGYPFAGNPAGMRPAVKIMTANPTDTGDQSAGNNTDSDGDRLDDGFEYSWDVWQRDHSGEEEVFLYDEAQPPLTNTVPDWTNPATRFFSPGVAYAAAPDGSPDFDVLYDYRTGGVSAHWYDSYMEYNAWEDDAFYPNYPEAPHSIRRDLRPETPRCSHPFKMDVDGDGLPDGYEVVFGYDPWVAASPGSPVADGGANPDGDYMAYRRDGASVWRHREVYNADGFDPRVAWGPTYPGRNNMPGFTGAGTVTPNTRIYSNVDEMRGADGAMRLTPLGVGTNGLDDATRPYSNDSDGDGMWDGWELYVGLDPSAYYTSDAGLDPDEDELSNLDEFRSFVTSSTNMTQLVPLPEWMNKIFPTDPNDADTDADGIEDEDERAVFNAAAGTDLTMTTSILPGGTVVTQTFAVGTWGAGCFTQSGLMPTSCDTDADGLPDPWEANPWETRLVNGTVDDRHFDPDGDKLENYQEYLTTSVGHWQYDQWAPGQPSYDPGAFYTGIPYGWDWSAGNSARDYYYVQRMPGNVRYPYSGADPSSADTDGDGMDDYYEAFHGLNPLYGIQDMVLSKLYDFPMAIEVPVADPRTAPWVVGSPFMDSDGDGLPNDDEGGSVSGWPSGIPISIYRTDPTPAWYMDIGYPNSWPNLYYQGNDAVWYWGGLPPPPTYVFDFEMNEGYDTDNDGVSDYDELVTSQTDVLSAESPVRRRALYLPAGKDGYCRTMPTFWNNLETVYEGEYGFAALERFTIEAWVKPIQAATGQRQVILERPFLIPQGNPLNLTPAIRANFRLAVNPAGVPYVEYNGKGSQYVFAEPQSSFGVVLPTNAWTHLAATFTIPSATNMYGTLTLYVNGEIKATSSGEIPAVGTVGAGGTVFAYGAPIVIGASDNNPPGVVNGLYGAGSAPQPYDFFRGWIDEVRIWNGARSQREIQLNMARSLKQTDVLEEVSVGVTNIAQPHLYYSYTFDDLPDPDNSPVSPEGYDIVGSGITPLDYPAIAWWGGAPDRSKRYADYRYVPWIQNTVAHMPMVPPRDIGDSTLSVTNADGSLRVRFANTSNPYNFWYMTGENILEEAHPFTTMVTSTGNIERDNVVFTDLLPLRWAESDEDAVLWDGYEGTNTTYDTDGDGMPDAWEIEHGLDPNDATGINGAYGDPDHDGLSNLYEYYAGTAPWTYDTDGDGLRDFDSYTGTVYRTYGEIYSDMDGMPDDWEYENLLDPQLYDAQDDPDGDGWSNYAEYMGGTYPRNYGSRPNPSISGHVSYRGLNTQGPLVVLAYKTPTMDDVPVRNVSRGNTATEALVRTGPNTFSGQLANQNIISGTVRVMGDGVTDFQDDATGEWTYQGADAVPTAGGADVTFDYATGTYSFTYEPGDVPGVARITYEYAGVLPPGQFTINRLTEGTVYLFVFRDVNDNGAYDLNEPCGTAITQPIHLGWGDVENVDVALYDQADVPWYNRFAWTAGSGVGEWVFVRIYTLGPPKTLLLTKWLRNTRSFWADQDYRSAVYTSGNSYYGLPTGYSYQWQVTKDDSGASSSFIASNTFFYSTGLPAPVPQLVYPVGGHEIITARDQMRFTMSNTTAGVELQIGPAGGAWTYTNRFLLPARDENGRYFQTFPFFFGDGSWTNGNYQWRLRGFKSDGSSSAWSATGLFVVNLREPPLGMPEVSGDLLYFGKASGTNNLTNIVVQAFTANGFGGYVSARKTYTYVCDTNNPSYVKVAYQLLGLNRAQYYIRAFVDMNANGLADAWEPQGFVEDVAMRPRMIDLNYVARGDGLRIVLRDRDTDNDGLPDAWEWNMLGTLAWGAEDDPDNDLASNLMEYQESRYDSNPSIPDTDGDGLLDGYEILNGLNPNLWDTDGDGLSDGDEVNLYHSNPKVYDTDGDGVPDGVEVAAGTDATDPNSVLRLYAAEVGIQGLGGSQGMGMQWMGASGISYRVQRSADLSQWFDAEDGYREGYGVHSYADGQGLTNRIRFYRVKVLTP